MTIELTQTQYSQILFSLGVAAGIAFDRGMMEQGDEILATVKVLAGQAAARAFE